MKNLLSALRQNGHLLPATVARPALMMLWLKHSLKLQLIIATILASLIFLTPMISDALADHLYPAKKENLGRRLAKMFKGTSSEVASIRDRRYQQFQAGFWLIGSGSIIILIILDLPRLRRLGEQQSKAQLQQAETLKQSNPDLSRTLSIKAQQLLIQPATTPENSEQGSLAKTYTGPSPLSEGARHVGAGQRYRIEKSIASGGAGIVYLACDTLLKRNVALKELFDDVAQDPEQAARFKVEAQALAAFNHPHIVPVYDMFEENSHVWLVMELLTGGDLSAKIKTAGPLPIAESLNIIAGIADGLAYAHDQGFVHRDVKPENILFAADGGFRLTDFGIAKTTESNIKTQQGIILGSPGYMSPEQASGEALDLRSDIYSLGITLYQMLTGSIPFEGDTSSVLIKHITQQPKLPSSINPEIPANIDTLVMKMLEKKADMRFDNCRQLKLALAELQA